MALTTIDDRGLKTPIDLLDNEKIRFGTGNDLEISHDGSNSFIKDTGTGNLIIQSNYVELKIADGSEHFAKFNDHADVELYYDGSKKLETSAGGVSITGELAVTSDVHFNSATNAAKDVYWDESASELQFSDNVYATFGTGEDLKIYHDGSDSYVKHNGAGNFYVQTSEASVEDLYLQAGNDVYIRVQTGETAIKAIGDGAVELYNDNIKTFETTAGGIRVLGPEGGAGEVAIYADEGDDNADKWKLKMDGSNVFRIQNYASGSWENAIAAVGDGAVELYYDGSKKLETTSAGARVTGNLHVTSNLLLEDNDKARFGDGEDLQIYHNGTNSYLNNATGNTFIQGGGGTLYLQAVDDENAVKVYANAQVELYYDGSKKLETSSSGGVLTGEWELSNGLTLKDITKGQSTTNRDVTDTSNWQDVTSDNVNRTMGYHRGDVIIIDAFVSCGIALATDGENHGGMYIRLKITDGSNTAYGDEQKSWYRNDNEAINEIIQQQYLKYVIGSSNTTFDNASTLTVSLQFKHIASQGTVGTSVSRWDSNRWITVTRYKKST